MHAHAYIRNHAFNLYAAPEPSKPYVAALAFLRADEAAFEHPWEEGELQDLMRTNAAAPRPAQGLDARTSGF